MTAAVEGENSQSNVLVVGDWLVDEHWVVGRHRSSTSNRTGRDHSRALHTDQGSIRSLCGAGQVATILYQAEYRHHRPFTLTGMGVWHTHDTASLAAMLDPMFNCGRTPHRLTAVAAPVGDTKHAAMHNLSAPGARVGTTRVIRIFENGPAGIDLRQRLDWELPLSSSDAAKIRKTAAEAVSSLASDITHIVIKDLRKGVVTTDLVRALRSRFSQACWYVSTKEWDPEWLKALETAHLRLIMIPKIAAQRAITNRIVSSTWMTSGGASNEALEAVRALATRFPLASVVVLPDDRRILAYEAHPQWQEARGIALPKGSQKQPFFPYLPMASVLFPALVSQMATVEMRTKATSLSRDSRRQSDLLPMLQEGLAFTERWQAHERLRLSEPAAWKPAPQQTFVLHDHVPRSDRPGRWHCFQWGEAKQEWDMALDEVGLVTVGDGHGAHVRQEFQLWRGMTEIEGYVACDPAKRLALSHLVREGTKLRDSLADERRHRSFTLVDVPGSGKSYLIDRLGSELGLESKHFNVTRLTTKNEIFDWFQEIAGAQSSSRRPLLVFVDEINATVGGNHIYDAFLEPLEDGKYVRSGSVWRLSPCFWIFAGTKNPKDSTASDKGEDFVSRLSHPVFHFEHSRDLESDIARVERVYVGVSCLHQRFPEVTQISPRVLRAFYLLSKAVPREVRRFVWDFEEVQYSRVTARNLPKEWRWRFESNAKVLYDAPEDERDLVDIKINPDPVDGVH